MKQKLIYYSQLLIPALTYTILQTYSSQNGPLLSETHSHATLIYTSQIIIAILSLAGIWAVFNTLKTKPTYASLALSLPATLVIIQYHLSYQSNLLWLLPMQALIYITMYKRLTTPC